MRRNHLDLASERNLEMSFNLAGYIDQPKKQERIRNDEAYPYRTDRFYLQNQQWFYTTRETLINGPFSSKAEAERACKLALRIEFSHETSIAFSVAWG